MVTLQEVLSAAKSLRHAEQATLVQAIWDQLPSSDWPRPNEGWIEEAKRRSTQYDAGEMKVATWPEVQARARKMVGLGE